MISPRVLTSSIICAAMFTFGSTASAQSKDAAAVLDPEVIAARAEIQEIFTALSEEWSNEDGVALSRETRLLDAFEKILPATDNVSVDEVACKRTLCRVTVTYDLMATMYSFGELLMEKMYAMRLGCELYYPGDAVVERRGSEEARHRIFLRCRAVE